MRMASTERRRVAVGLKWATGYNGGNIATEPTEGVCMRFCRYSIFGALAAWTLAACHQPMPSPSIGVGNPYPVSSYVCDGARLGVRLMGDRASVSVDGATAVDLPAIGESGTTFSNGRQTLLIEQGRTSWAVGRAMPVACTGG